ncbi:transposase [Litoribrevibacter euphylliae]|uniref:Transposase n=1 Tax=Litoribrevibacter euphylliae TaxID=1834034 RepID=A0ABV7HE92_9GAMM
MARKPRLSLPNIPQHIIQRGNNRQPCFFDQQDFKVYLCKLEEYTQKYQVSVHAFVLMTNHVHLLMAPTESNGISKVMQSLGRYYVRYFNHTYKRTGTLWEGRYKSSLIDSDNYFLTVSRYIELNPVRAAMVQHPAEYPWSSYQGNALGKPISLLTPHPCYLQLGHTPAAQQQRYRSLFTHQIPNWTIDQINTATNKEWVLGNHRFKDYIEQQTGRQTEPKPKGGDRRSANWQRSQELAQNR